MPTHRVEATARSAWPTPSLQKAARRAAVMPDTRETSVRPAQRTHTRFTLSRSFSPSNMHHTYIIHHTHKCRSSGEPSHVSPTLLSYIYDTTHTHTHTHKHTIQALSGPQACVACPTGWRRAKEWTGHTCYPCPSGAWDAYFKNPDPALCACPAGEYELAFGIDCGQCPAGKYRGALDGGRCQRFSKVSNVVYLSHQVAIN